MGKFYVFCKGYAKYERKGKTFVISIPENIYEVLEILDESDDLVVALCRTSYGNIIRYFKIDLENI